MQDATSRAISPVRFAQGSAMRLAGLRRRYAFAERGDVPAQWEAFVPTMDEVPGRIGANAFGFCIFRPDGFDYLTMVQVTEDAVIPPRFDELSVPVRRCAVFAHADHVSLLPRTIDAVFKQWLPGSGERLGAAPELTEVYDESFDAERGSGGVELWIALAG